MLGTASTTLVSRLLDAIAIATLSLWIVCDKSLRFTRIVSSVILSNVPYDGARRGPCQRPVTALLPRSDTKSDYGFTLLGRGNFMH